MSDHPRLMLGLLLLFFTLAVVFIVLYCTSGTNTISQMLNNRAVSEANKALQKTIIFTSNPFDVFDQIYFVNLDKRTDRKYEMEQELQKMNVNPQKVTRISGVIDKFGALGCSKAHLNALLDCQSRGFDTCLILEDDFMFRDGREATCDQLSKFWKLNMTWDVLLFACNVQQFEVTDVNFLLRIKEGQTTSGYAINKAFLPKLIENVEAGIKILETYNQQEHDFCIDIYWKKLQSSHFWYTFSPLMGYQRESFSDIEQRVIEYNDKRQLTDQIQKVEYLICVKTCRSRWQKYPEQLLALQEISKNHPVQYLFYYGDENLPQPFQLDLPNHTVILKCKDDYLNLPHKFNRLLSMVNVYMSLNVSLKSLKGIFFTDDDITLLPKHFYSFLEKHASINYWGNVTSHVGKNRTISSSHIISKAEKSQTFLQSLQGYPQLLTFPIVISSDKYCSGGGFFLTVPAFVRLLQMDSYFQPFPSPENIPFHLVTHPDGTFLNHLSVFDDYEVGRALHVVGIDPVHVDLKLIARWQNM